MKEAVDTKKIAQRIMQSLAEAHQDEIERLIKRLLENRSCESPIEAMLGAALVTYDRLFPQPEHLVISSQTDVGHFGPTARVLVFQYRFENYRIDWVMCEPPHTIFIECDGHNFHERTKEQAAHDRQKDRAIQQSGYPILRFTGSEIYGDPISCASQVFDFLGDTIMAEHFKQRSA